MALYIPYSIFHLARLFYVRPENFGPYYVRMRVYVYACIACNECNVSPMYVCVCLCMNVCILVL